VARQRATVAERDLFDRFIAGTPHRHLPWIVLLAILPACGGSPTNPDPVPPPTVTCPADIQASARLGQPPVIVFDTPVAAGGAAPVSTTCAPASNTAFPLGATRVTCTATDSRGKTGTCGFTVMVSAVPVLSSVRFLAFGDSITEGTTSPDPVTMVLSLTESYPYKLQNLLSGRYVDQTVVVVNRGKAGEPAYPTGMTRFPRELDANNPQVVLLLDGANDLLGAASTGTFNAAIARISTALEEMIQSARARNVQVMLATFPPQNPAGSRGGAAGAVPLMNQEIVRLAAKEGVPLVDLYGGLGGTPVGTIGVDGLHPTDTGYTKIASIWFTAIQRLYEQPSAATGATRQAPRLVIPEHP
jgi:lysophospholipase L1-like esterase